MCLHLRSRTPLHRVTIMSRIDTTSQLNVSSQVRVGIGFSVRQPGYVRSISVQQGFSEALQHSPVFSRGFLRPRPSSLTVKQQSGRSALMMSNNSPVCSGNVRIELFFVEHCMFRTRYYSSLRTLQSLFQHPRYLLLF